MYQRSLCGGNVPVLMVATDVVELHVKVQGLCLLGVVLVDDVRRLSSKVLIRLGHTNPWRQAKSIDGVLIMTSPTVRFVCDAWGEGGHSAVSHARSAHHMDKPPDGS